jgi:hypothetical protein
MPPHHLKLTQLVEELLDVLVDHELSHEFARRRYPLGLPREQLLVTV